MRYPILLLGGLLSTLAFAIQANDHKHDHDHDHSHSEESAASLSAHEHGVASLNLVLDGQHVIIELQSPAANIVGFEHLPTSETDLATAKQARLRLEQAQNLFVFTKAAACTLEESEADSPLFAGAGTEPTAEHDEHHEDHGGEHHDDHGVREVAHADITAQFHFACANPEALQEIDVKLFDAFPNTEKLLLQAITPKGQQGGELTPAQSVIRL
jgi:hypothetical protein